MNKRALGEFGQRIRQLRKARGLTQERLATKAGLHYTYVGAVERGEKNISLINIKNLARALEVEVCAPPWRSNPFLLIFSSVIEVNRLMLTEKFNAHSSGFRNDRS